MALRRHSDRRQILTLVVALGITLAAILLKVFAHTSDWLTLGLVFIGAGFFRPHFVLDLARILTGRTGAPEGGAAPEAPHDP